MDDTLASGIRPCGLQKHASVLIVWWRWRWMRTDLNDDHNAMISGAFYGCGHGEVE